MHCGRCRMLLWRQCLSGGGKNCWFAERWGSLGADLLAYLVFWPFVVCLHLHAVLSTRSTTGSNTHFNHHTLILTTILLTTILLTVLYDCRWLSYQDTRWHSRWVQTTPVWDNCSCLCLPNGKLCRRRVVCSGLEIVHIFLLRVAWILLCCGWPGQDVLKLKFKP